MMIFNSYIGVEQRSTRPIKQCYWVVPGKFLAGEYPRDLNDATSIQKISALLEAGVTRFIDLTEKDEGLKPYDDLLNRLGASQAHQRFSVVDLSIPEDDTTHEILSAIDMHIDKGEVVYLHCWGGVGRTGTLVGCWLAQNGFLGQQALEQLQQLWQQCPKSQTRRSPENTSQEQYILKWGCS